MAARKQVREPSRGRGRPRKYEEDAAKFLVRFPVDMYEALQKLRDRSGTTINDLVLLSLREWLPWQRPADVREKLEKLPPWRL